MTLSHVVLAFIAWKLFLERKPPRELKGDLEIGEPTIGSNVDEWAQWPGGQPR